MLNEAILGWTALSFGLCLVITWGLTPWIRSWAIRRNLLDRAEQFHTTHVIAVPRLGGVALVIAFLFVFFLIVSITERETGMLRDESWILLWSCLAMFGLGFWDDLKSLGAKRKLVIQIIIASLAYGAGLRISGWTNPLTQVHHWFGLWSFPITVLWIVSVTNLINLVDGVDGLAAGLSLLLMLLLGIVGGLSGHIFILLLCLGMAGALLGFLFHNFPPAKIFMGDGGAYFLGALIAELALLNSNKGEVAVALIAPFLALGLPIIDTAYTILRRGFVGLPIFRADRKHIHHRLSGMGFSKQRVVLLLYAVCVAFSLLALGVFISQGRLLPVLFGVLMIVVIFFARSFGFIHGWYKLGHLLTSAMLRRRQTRYTLLLGEILLIEAEWCATPEALWKNFGTMLEKTGFSSASFRCADAVYQWSSPHEAAPSVARREVSQNARGSISGQMTLVAESSRMEADTFHLIAELSTEFWGKALQRQMTSQRRKPMDAA